MDFHKILQQISEERKSIADGLTIGELMAKLTVFDGNTGMVFSNGKYLDGRYDSYRGYYEDMYVGYSDTDEDYNTVRDLTGVLKKALEDGEMTGYKGGEFSIDEDTLVWFATYGTTRESEMIVDAQEIEGKVVIYTAEED